MVPCHRAQPIVFKFIPVTLWLFDMAFGYRDEETTLPKKRPCQRNDLIEEIIWTIKGTVDETSRYRAEETYHVNHTVHRLSLIHI